MTVIEGAACLPKCLPARTTVVISDPFVTMPDGPLLVQAVSDDVHTWSDDGRCGIGF